MQGSSKWSVQRFYIELFDFYKDTIGLFTTDIFIFFFTQHNYSERNCFVMKTVIYFLYLLLDDYYIYFSPEVQESSPSSLSSVFAFTSENPQGPSCHVDLSIKPNKPGNHTLCVKAKDQRFVKRFIT